MAFGSAMSLPPQSVLGQGRLITQRSHGPRLCGPREAAITKISVVSVMASRSRRRWMPEQIELPVEEVSTNRQGRLDGAIVVTRWRSVQPALILWRSA